MKFIGLAILAILSGYNGGLLFDVHAQSNDSGKFEKKWIPFGLGDVIITTQNFLLTYPFEGGPYVFQNAFLSDTDVFDHAFVDFTISKGQNSDGTFSNRVTECVFRTNVDVNTECVVCILSNGLGNIAKGEVYFESPYIANTPITLEMTHFLNDDPNVIDIQNVKGIQIGMCEEKLENNLENGGNTN
jgi:hypothetical protein